MDAHLGAAREEIKLTKLQERRRKLDAEISATVSRRREYMDQIHQYHWNLSQPVVPFEDTPDLVLKVAT